MYIKDSAGHWRVAVPRVRQGNTWREVSKVLYKVNDKWETVYDELVITRNIKFINRLELAQGSEYGHIIRVISVCLDSHDYLYVAAYNYNNGNIYIYKVNTTTLCVENRIIFTYDFIQQVEIIDGLLHVFTKKTAYKYTLSLSYTGASYAHNKTYFDDQKSFYSAKENCYFNIIKNSTDSIYTKITKIHSTVGQIYTKTLYNIMPHITTDTDLERIIVDSNNYVYVIYGCGADSYSCEIAKFEQY